MRGHSRACYICYLLSIELIHVIYWLGYMHLTMIVRREADLEWNLYASILIETFDLLAIVLSVMLHLVSILSLFILIQFLFFSIRLTSFHVWCTTFNTFNLTSFEYEQLFFFRILFVAFGSCFLYISLRFHSHCILHAVIQFGIFFCPLCSHYSDDLLYHKVASHRVDEKKSHLLAVEIVFFS